MLRIHTVGSLPEASVEGADGSRALAAALEECAAAGLGFRLLSVLDDHRIALVPLPISVHNTGAAGRAWSRLVTIFHGRPLDSPSMQAAEAWTLVAPSSLRSQVGISVKAGLLDRFQIHHASWLLECAPRPQGVTRASRGAWSVVAGLSGIGGDDARFLQSSMLTHGSVRRVGEAGMTLPARRLLSPVPLMPSQPALESGQVSELLITPARGDFDLGDGNHHPAITQAPEELWSHTRAVDISRHLLITGNPGTGKSYALFDLLTNGHPALSGRFVVVIDPSKPASELSPLTRAGFRLYEPGQSGPINPLIGPPGCEVEYSEYLLNAIDQATSLSMMFPLGRSILNNSLSALRHSGEPPSAALLLREVTRNLMGTRKSANVADAVISLRERLLDVFDANGRGLMCGGSDASIPWDTLMQGKTVISLTKVGSMAQRRLLSLCLLAGIVAKAKSQTDPKGLVIVLEEAHFFTQGGTADDHPSTLVELLSDGLAELRSRKIGFILAEQLPNLLPETILSNAGNFVAFASRDRLQAERIAATLGGDQGIAKLLRALPDRLAVTRFGDEPRGRLAQSFSRVDTSVASVLSASGAASSFSVPWCVACPRPCEAPASRQDAIAVRERLRLEGRPTRAAPAMQEAARLLVSRRTPVLEGQSDQKHDRLAVFCLAARITLEESAGPYQDLLREREKLKRWVTTSQTTIH